MSPKMPPRLLIFLLFTLVTGCSHNPTTAELAQVYRTGMTREEVANALGKPMAVTTRPAEGWAQQEKTPERIGAFAGRFEETHNATVQTCEVYWVMRGFMGMGIWWDYLFYGPDDRLLGFQRRFID